eukprot:6186069-Pleurochrysis_carterae.AAC.1
MITLVNYVHSPERLFGKIVKGKWDRNRQPSRVAYHLVTVSQKRSKGVTIRRAHVTIALNMTPLAKVIIEKYYLAVDSNLNIGGFHANMSNRYQRRVV